MGIPGFFRNIVTKIPKSHFWNKDTKIDFLFLDFNSIIYTSAANVSKMKTWNFKSNKDTKDFEKTLIDYIIDDTKNLVNNIIKPTRLIYIAIDGVPPLTKMRQQRERRAKPMIIKEMEKKYFPETYLENASWDKTKITPGTEFMYNLCTEFKRQIDKKAFKKLDVVFSGADIPGEAEHKYLSFIKRIDPKKDDVYCVYSNDADQIVLLLQFPNKKFYILHDITADLEDKYPDDQRFVYLDIQKFSGEIFTIFDVNKKEVVSNNSQKNLDSFLRDYIFLSFLEGNDFVKHIYYLKMKTDHMKTLMGIYKDIRFLRGSRLIESKDNKLKINYDFFLELFEKLTERESAGLFAHKSKVEKYLRFGSRRNNRKNEDEFGMAELEHLFFYDRKNPLFKDYMRQWNYLFEELSPDVFKPKYYKHFFGINYDINDICKKYLEVLVFNLRYYFGEKVYWRFQYDARVAPLPSDVYQYLLENPKILEQLTFEEKNPFEPIELLMYVLSADNGNLLPANVEKVRKEKMAEYFPDHLDLDLLTGDKLIYTEPLLKHIPLPELEKVYKLAKKGMTKNAKDRNINNKIPYVYRGGISKNKLNLSN